jgi:hypothetical protein
LNGILIGAMVTMGVALAVLLVFLWFCFLSKKGVKEENKYAKIEPPPKNQTGIHFANSKSYIFILTKMFSLINVYVQ